MRSNGILVTGATGLVGGETLKRLLARDRDLRAYVLVRDRARWLAALAHLRLPLARVIPVTGDVTRPGLGIAPALRAELRRDVRVIVHAAADTTFSRPLELARRVNRDGTLNLLELAADWPDLERFLYVSTAFVAGRMTGGVPERAHDGTEGFVNAYEQSKHEAEAVVRASALPWVIARSSTIVCENERGEVRQTNAVHRALALHRAGLASLMPGQEDTPVDLVTNAYVSEGLARLANAPEAAHGTFHLCAGANAISLGDMLDLSHATWSESDAWRRRGIARPALTDLATYRLFERTVDEAGDARLRRITRALSHFVPQLALPKRFETARTDALLGFAASPVASYFRRVLLRDPAWLSCGASAAA